MDEILLGLVGVVLSVTFNYLPAAKNWYEAQSNKGLLMLAFVFLISALYFGASCLPIDLGVAVECTQAGALEVVKGFVSILIGNQLAYLVSPKA